MVKLSLDDLFGDQEIDLECPTCNKEFQVMFSQISEDNSEIQCPNCNVVINMQHDETTKRTFHDSEQSLDEFKTTFSELEKSFKKFK
ncbi:hypothetical protein D1872_279920 [compost metagenome]